MNEYESRLRSVSNEIVGLRNSSGITSTTLMFGVLALLKSKNKITDKDLDIIFEVEKQGVKKTLDDYFEKNYGDESSQIANEEELKQVVKFCYEYVDNMKTFVTNAAKEINPPKKKTNKDS
jgi:hypothetical protein